MLRSRALPLLLAVLGLTACSACSNNHTASQTASAPGAGPQAAPQTSARDLSLVGDYRPVEVATVGWDQLSQAPVVLLRDLESGQLVPIWVGVAEARAIASALHEVRYPRPMTHDLMTNLLGALHAHLDELLIHDIVNGTYYGLLRLTPQNNGGGPLLVDTRPSDGMALALRAGASIRVAQKIFDETPEIDFLAPEEGEQVVSALGLTVVSPDAELRREFSLPQRDGLVVLRAGSAATDAGLRRGDLLLSAAGAALAEPVDLLQAVRDTAPGDEVTVRYWRDGREAEARIVLAPPPTRGPKRTA